jgi:iron complex outermembrane receptor protein
MGVRAVGSVGSYHFRRIFGLFNTGAIGPWGTRVFVAGSTAKNHVPFNNYGKIDKQQYNARIWQPIGSNGDFISVAGHYNENRNNFFGSLPLRLDPDREVGSGITNRFPANRHERFYHINFPCTLDTPTAGAADSPNSCGTEFDRRYNPSNTGNIRGSSKFTLADGLVLTVDPSYQYVKANGGGTVSANEGFRTVGGQPLTGYIGGAPYFGRDLNGDGDVLDRVTLLAPSQTHTDRFGVIAGLRWDFNPQNIFRVTYTLDHARHRQTGEVGVVENNGEPADVFPINDPLADLNGNALEKRDRLSYAILNQVAGEYNGIFGRLQVNAGLRAPFFQRKLNNFCYTTSANGFVDCFGSNDAAAAIYQAANPYSFDPVTHVVTGASPPQERDFDYHKLLPNVGFVYNITNPLSVFANFAKGLSVPSTDNLYNSFFFPADTSEAKPKPEETDSFDGGFRYTSSKVQAILSGWYTKFTNRQAQAYDPVLERSVFRNLGTVDKYGVDGSIAYSPSRLLTLYAFASVLKSKIRDNIQIGALPAGIASCDDPGAPISACAFTKGNYESGAPKYMYGASAVGHLGDFELGVNAKRTGPRYVYDTNVPTFKGPIASPTEIYPSKTPAYWLVNLEARYSLRALSPRLEKTWLQLNVYNLFDQYYVGGFGGGLNQALSGSNYGNPNFVQIGAPRSIVGTLNIAF